jgi:hypothetical protein
MRGPAGPALLVGADLRLRAWRGRRHELCPPPARAGPKSERPRDVPRGRRSASEGVGHLWLPGELKGRRPRRRVRQ